MAVFYGAREGKLVRENALLAALSIPDQPHLVISLVGAGGKTTTMYRLADELAAAGKRVIVTTTTHIFYPEDRRVAVTDCAKEVLSLVHPGEVVVAGQPCGWGNDGADQPYKKMQGLPLCEISKLAAGSDVLLIEADGAKRMPLKVPRDGEPVIPIETHMVIACAGLDCLSQPFRDACFRFDTNGGWIREDGTPARPEDPVKEEDLVKILTDRRGMGKETGERMFRVVLNKADDDERKQWALNVADGVKRRTGALCAVTSYNRQ